MDSGDVQRESEYRWENRFQRKIVSSLLDMFMEMRVRDFRERVQTWALDLGVVDRAVTVTMLSQRE